MLEAEWNRDDLWYSKISISEYSSLLISLILNTFRFLRVIFTGFDLLVSEILATLIVNTFFWFLHIFSPLYCEEYRC